jgi:hypothetical protein
MLSSIVGWLLDKAGWQGHACAIPWLGCMHKHMKEDEQALQWATKCAEAGLPEAIVVSRDVFRLRGPSVHRR